MGMHTVLNFVYNFWLTFILFANRLAFDFAPFFPFSLLAGQCQMNKGNCLPLRYEEDQIENIQQVLFLHPIQSLKSGRRSQAQVLSGLRNF